MVSNTKSGYYTSSVLILLHLILRCEDVGSAAVLVDVVVSAVYMYTKKKIKIVKNVKGHSNHQKVMKQVTMYSLILEANTKRRKMVMPRIISYHVVPLYVIWV